MKTEKLPTILLAFCIPALSKAQGTLENLDFESAHPGAGSSGINEPVASLLPGWRVFYGTGQQTQMNYNEVSTGAAAATLVSASFQSRPALDGNYSVFLQSGEAPDRSGVVGTSLVQDGTVPAGAQLLEFKAWNSLGSAPLTVSFDGNNLPLTLISAGESPSGQPYDLFGANIAQYAGETGALNFTASFPNWTELDDISFSSSSAPEPSPLLLTAFGGFALALHRRFKRHR